MFTERKISAFQQRVAELPDVPNLSAAALKARFDACPEELRQALNGVCDDGKALEERIDAYRAQTFTGEITETMLDSALAGKLNGKAEQSALEAMESRMNAAETALQAKCEVVFGTYTGNGASSRTIELGFTPKAVLVERADGARFNYSSVFPGGLALQGNPCKGGSYEIIQIVENGFIVCAKASSSNATNSDGSVYYYIAFK